MIILCICIYALHSEHQENVREEIATIRIREHCTRFGKQQLVYVHIHVNCKVSTIPAVDAMYSGIIIL